MLKSYQPWLLVDYSSLQDLYTLPIFCLYIVLATQILDLLADRRAGKLQYIMGKARLAFVLDNSKVISFHELCAITDLSTSVCLSFSTV